MLGGNRRAVTERAVHGAVAGGLVRAGIQGGGDVAVRGPVVQERGDEGVAGAEGVGDLGGDGGLKRECAPRVM